MESTTLPISDNMLVDIAYVLTVENEQGARQQKPVAKQFVQGSKQVVPGLEQALYGMSVGDEKEVVVKAAEGYGELKPGAVKTLSRQSVPTAAKAQPGERVRLLHKRSGAMHKATVVEVQDENIVLDFNHPLAGKTLRYHVRVVDVRPTMPEEPATE